MEEKCSLTQKEINFCRYFILTGNHREAAARAGFLFPDKTGLRLLDKEKIIRQIKDLNKNSGHFDQVYSGLKRIAFGPITDAIKLAFDTENAITNIDVLDLFNVSEIKLTKNGSIEVKFFDRIKALERLNALFPETSNEDSNSFINAIIKGAGSLKNSDWGQDNEI